MLTLDTVPAAARHAHAYMLVRLADAPTVAAMSQPAAQEDVLARLAELGVPAGDLTAWRTSPAVDLQGMLALLEPPYQLSVDDARAMVSRELPSWVVSGYLDRGHPLDDIVTLWEATTRSALLMLGLAQHLGASLTIDAIDYLSRLGVPLTKLMLTADEWNAGAPPDGAAARLALAHWLLYESSTSEAHEFAIRGSGQAWVDTAARLALDGMKIDAAIEAAHRLERTPAAGRVRIHHGKNAKDSAHAPMRA